MSLIVMHRPLRLSTGRLLLSGPGGILRESPDGSGCVNFVPRLHRQMAASASRMLATRISVQALRNRQLSLDPLRDQAFGKSQAPHLG